MHLRSLNLRGFKSFATSTSLTFEPGINCVVGPNGSGKSNVVDALSWVMGEQGVKNLRGASMADVIFAGTSKRPALGRAEVSLTIDNSDGALPIDYREVTISRTLFRSGGSEYAINGTPCRLLDIQELLSDTGMGKEMHVIIGQGRLDEVLTATPEERRGFIEEAAGVLKHRRRKDKALRKIESMKASFARIEDLTAELRRQLGPLAKQAEAARRAQVIQATVRDARARLLADDIARQQARLLAHNADEAQLEERRLQARATVKQLRDDLALLEQEAALSHPHLASLIERCERIGSLEERFRSLSQLASERHRFLSSAHKPYRGEMPEDIRERARVAREEEEELRARVDRAHDELTQAISLRENNEKEERAAEQLKVELARALGDRREDEARVAGQITAALGRIESLEGELERVQQAQVLASERATQATLQVSALEQEVVAESNADDTLTQAHEESARALAQAKTQLEEARHSAQEARSNQASWEAKVDTFKLLLEPEDATAWAWRNCAGISGLLRDSLTVTPGWEAAAEAALQGAAGGVVASSIEVAVDTLRASRAAQEGRLYLTYDAGHIPQDMEKMGERKRAQLEKALAQAAVDEQCAVAALRVIKVDGEIAASVEYMLSGVALAVDLVTARALIAAGAPCVATLDGDVLTHMSAYGGEVSQSSILARQTSYDEAVREAENAREAVSIADVSVDEAQHEVSAAQAEYERTGYELSTRDSHVAAVTAQLGVLRQSLTSAKEEEQRNVSRAEVLKENLAVRRSDLEALTARQESLESAPTDIEEKLREAHEKHACAHDLTQESRRKETDARLALRTAEERLRAVAGKADGLMANAQSLEERIDREERQALRKAEAARLALQVESWANRALAVASRTRAAVLLERQAAEDSRSERDTHMKDMRTTLEAAEADARSLDDTAHQQELARAHVQMVYEQLVTRALDELGMNADTLVEEYGPHIPVPQEEEKYVPYVRQEQEKRLAKAERDMARLGKINPLALEEHAALEERQRYLTSQLEDLKKSRSDLLGIVRDIDERVEQVMTAALADVAEKFVEIFARLFPGGEGRMVITSPEDVLTTGVEIEARPPGKRVKRLSLLSGGERSLTAVAFLVAIFMARPSPFYVMDEVEAALDDVNLSRLIEIFKDLQRSSQLLIVTHQKRTMEIADTLYGVTMKESGVSTVVSQRMRDVEPS